MTLPQRTRTVLAWALWLATMGCCAAGLVAALLVARPLTAQVVLEGAWFALGFPFGYATVGLVLTLRRPANPIGWLSAAAALTWSLVIPLGPWLDQLVRDRQPLPLAAQLTALGELTVWAPAIALGITLPALVVPDGRLRSRRWGWVAGAAVAGSTMFVVGVLLIPGPTSDTPVAFDNPFGQPGLAGTVAKGMAAAGLALHFASLPAALLCVILRFRASRGVERQQLRWVATGAAVALTGLTVPLGGIRGAWLDPVLVLLVPYLLVVPAASELVAGAGSLAVAAATLAVAGLFQPLRRRVQDLVDRRFNRRRSDAARTVEGFARRLRDQVDLDALHRELLEVVDQTMQPTRASLWLRPARPRA
jgi:hypothetical protein